jgi:hypothetical protein
VRAPAVLPRPRRRPRALIEAISHLREARLLLTSVYRVTEAAEIHEIVKRLDRVQRGGAR